MSFEQLWQMAYLGTKTFFILLILKVNIMKNINFLYFAYSNFFPRIDI